jgi:hypothetical protein
LRDELTRSEDGTLVVRGAEGAVPFQDHIVRFLDENPELLPARNLSGSGATSSPRSQQNAPGIDIDSIKPGMSSEDKARIREEISRVARSFQ